MRIVHITTVHRWDDGRIFDRQARSLRDAGHEVYIVAPGDVKRELGGVHIVPLGEPKGRRDRMWRFATSARRAVDLLSPDVVIIHDPELLRLILRMSIRRERCALVYDAHEDYRAQISDKEWLPAAVRRPAASVLGYFEQRAARRADRVFAATPSIARRFHPSRTVVVLNRPRVADVPMPRELDDEQNRAGSTSFRLVYVGDLREVRGAHSLVSAMGRFPERHVELHLVGRITPPSLERELGVLEGWSRVTTHGWKSREEVFRILADSDVAVLPFLPARNHIESQPNKLMEYLIMGLPIVMSDFPAWTEIAGSVGARFECFNPGDGHSMADALERVLASPDFEDRHHRALRSRATLSWEALEPHYVRAIEQL